MRLARIQRTIGRGHQLNTMRRNCRPVTIRELQAQSQGRATKRAKPSLPVLKCLAESERSDRA